MFFVPLAFNCYTFSFNVEDYKFGDIYFRTISTGKSFSLLPIYPPSLLTGALLKGESQVNHF